MVLKEVTEAKTEKELLLEILEDVQVYDNDKYKSELMKIRQKNISSGSKPSGGGVKKAEYNVRKRLQGMTILCNKFTHKEVQDTYLTNQEIYMQSKKVFTERFKRNLG
jgi:hypothetical protein